jgi:hypothetical protein
MAFLSCGGTGSRSRVKTLAASDGFIPNKTPPQLQPVFPADYAKGVVYMTLDRPENKEVSRIFRTFA